MGILSTAILGYVVLIVNSAVSYKTTPYVAYKVARCGEEFEAIKKRLTKVPAWSVAIFTALLLYGYKEQSPKMLWGIIAFLVLDTVVGYAIARRVRIGGMQ